MIVGGYWASLFTAAKATEPPTRLRTACDTIPASRKVTLLSAQSACVLVLMAGADLRLAAPSSLGRFVGPPGLRAYPRLPLTVYASACVYTNTAGGWFLFMGHAAVVYANPHACWRPGSPNPTDKLLNQRLDFNLFRPQISLNQFLNRLSVGFFPQFSPFLFAHPRTLVKFKMTPQT